MIKAVGKNKDGRTILFLGLTKENLQRLPQDAPIHIKAEELAEMNLTPPFDIVLLGGETEPELIALLGGAPVPDRRPNPGEKIVFSRKTAN